jgi:hypothetical protein
MPIIPAGFIASTLLRRYNARRPEISWRISTTIAITSRM